MKVSDLTIPQLNHWTAIALGWEQKLWGAIPVWIDPNNENRYQCHVSRWKPAEDWAQGGPIIESEQIMIVPPSSDFDECEWGASNCDESVSMTGQTPLIAAMRCLIASKFGDEVSDEI